MHNSKSDIKSGFIWSALDSFGNQAVNVTISIILAKILGPSAFGLVAMLTIFIAIAGVFVNSGFSSALIRKADRNEKDYSTTFYFSFLVSLACYLILYSVAPLIATFYEESELVALTRVISLTVVVQTFAIIPRTILTTKLDFKSQAKANFIALISSSSIGLTMAFNGFGVWSLVTQQITNAIISVIVLNLLSPWRPVEKFCSQAFEGLFSFGSRLLISGLLDTIYNNIYGLIIGKQFSAGQLGIFNQANTISSLPATTLTGVIQRVTYPMLSNLQNEGKTLDKAYLLTLKTAALVIFPIMLGISIIAEPLISLLLGADWKDSAKLISILTMGFMLFPVHAINLNMLQVKGRSDLFLRLEIIKKVLTTIMLVVTVPLGIVAMCKGMVVISYLSLILNTYYTAKLSSISQRKQLLELLPILLIGALSAIVGYQFGIGISSSLFSIIVMLAVSLIVYLSAINIFQKTLVEDVIKMLRGK
ncbi:lipopolysaccharide biosynthesis protein [Vibrio breoganii]